MRAHKNRKRWYKVVCAMASVVVFCTVYALILPAITMERSNPVCGLSEHTHTESCYTTEKKLICGKEESTGHQHSDECYDEDGNLTCGKEESEGHTHDSSCYKTEKILTCDKTEHTHTDACYPKESEESDTPKVTAGDSGENDPDAESDDASDESEDTAAEEETEAEEETDEQGDPDADVETASDWEATISGVTLTGTAADDLAAIAKTQVGYKESKKNYIINSYNEKKGYTRYGAWYGDKYADWSGLFVSWCLHYANVKVISGDEDCAKMMKQAKNADIYVTTDDSAPKAGDILFLDGGTGKSSSVRVGIVTKVSGDNLKVIEGDQSDQVKYTSYSTGSSEILGFAKLSEDGDSSAESTTESAGENSKEATTESAAENNEEGTTESAGENSEEAATEDAGENSEEAATASATESEEATTESKSTAKSVKRSAAARAAQSSSAQTQSESGPVDFTEYIDSVTISTLTDGNWTETTTVTDGDEVRVNITYTIPDGLVTTANNVITYQLPVNVVPNEEESGTVYQGGNAVGTYTISTSGLITITFNDDFATGESFTGSIQFEGTVHKTGTGDTDKIDFGGDSSSITIEKEKAVYDLNVKKSVEKTTDSDGNTILKYKVEATTTTGTGDTVTLYDQLKDCTAEVSYDKDSIAVYKVDASHQATVVTGYEVTDKQENGMPGFKIENLPELAAGETYVLEYTVKVDGLAADGSGKVNNAGGADSGKNKKWSWHSETVSKPAIEKSGSYSKTKDTITWKITVNNADKTDLSGQKVTDSLPDGISITDGSIVIKGADGKELTGDSFTISAEDFVKNGFTFPEGSTDTVYYIEYTTTAPEPEEGETSIKVENTATITDGEDSKTTTGEVTVTKRDWTVTKQYVKEETVDGEQYCYWNSSVEIPSSWTSVTLTDTIGNAHDKNTDADKGDDTHYAIASELQEYIKENLKLTLEDESTLGYSNDQVEFTVKYYDKEGNEVDASDTTTKVKKFTITAAPKTDSDGQPLTVRASKLTLNGYPTHVDYSGMSAGETWEVKNTASIPDKASTAKHDYTKPKQLTKMTGVTNTEWKNITYTDGDAVVDYDEINGILYYQLLIRTDSTTEGEITVTDTLPKGAVLVTEGDHTPTAYFWYNANYKTQYIEKHTSDGIKTYDLTDGETFTYTVGETAKDGTTKITFTFKDGYNLDGKTNILAIRYAISVKDDPSWKNLSNEELIYANKAEWGTNSDTTNTEVDRDVEKVEKSAEQETDSEGNKTNKVKYTVILNPAAQDLDVKSDTLSLVDTMSNIPSGVNSANIDLTTLKLYEYAVDENGDLKLENEIDTSRYTVKYDQEDHKLTMDIPDSLACVLVYTYVIDTGTADSPQLTNSVNLTSRWSDEVKYEVDTGSSSAKVQRGKFTLYKVDSENYKKLLADTKFSIYAYDKNTKTWSEAVLAVTNEDGEIVFNISSEADGTITSENDGTFTLKPNILYKIEETEAAEGYKQLEDPLYFIWRGKADGTLLDSAAAYKEATDTGNNLTIGDETVKKDEVHYYSGTSEDSLYLENEYSAIDVKKVWVDTDGKELTDHPDSATVVLKQFTGEKEQGCTVTLKAVEKDTGEEISSFVKTSEITVKKGSEITISMTPGWPNYYIKSGNGEAEEITKYDSNGYKVYTTTINEDTDLTVEVSSRYAQATITFSDYTEPGYTYGSGTDYETVTLDSSNYWTYTWTKLPSIDSNGVPYKYAVEEVNVPSGYEVSYGNNDGIEAGEIVVTNRKGSDQEDYNLPKTGGSGTAVYTLGGLFTMAAAFLMYKYHLRREENRGQTP